MATSWEGTRVLASGHRLRRRTQTVVNYVEDAYLRDDIPCGSQLCTACDNHNTFGASRVTRAPPLSADASHYLVPDAQALLARRATIAPHSTHSPRWNKFTSEVYICSLHLKFTARRVNEQAHPTE
jgi:hypothetical protein